MSSVGKIEINRNEYFDMMPESRNSGARVDVHC
jgi:hypothetical protein